MSGLTLYLLELSAYILSSAILLTFIKLPFSIKTLFCPILSGPLRPVLLYSQHISYGPHREKPRFCCMHTRKNTLVYKGLNLVFFGDYSNKS